jgi:DNA mismatch repair protein MutS
MDMSLTPMMQQYLEIKEANRDSLLMFRLGDFYELFFDDATTASKLLEITLTGRDAGSQGRIPMCGVPYHAAEQYIARLVDEGYCVAICEQVEDPKQTKGLVRREVIRVVTPGTTFRDDTQSNRFLAAVAKRNPQWAISFVDVATGEVWCAEYACAEDVTEALERWHPCELLMYAGCNNDNEWSLIHDWCHHASVRKSYQDEPRHAYQAALEAIQAQYQVTSLLPLDLDGQLAATEALGMALSYVRATQKALLPHLRTPKNLASQAQLVLDQTAQRNLEVVETNRSRQRKGSLFGMLDLTRTAMGSRLMRRWLERPLADVDQIQARLDAVSAFVEDLFVRSQVQDALDAVYDLERLIGKVSFGSANGRDLVAIAASLRGVPELSQFLLATPSALLQSIATHMPDLIPVAEEIDRMLVDQPPLSVREGGFIRAGADAELDELRMANSSGKEWLAKLEARERESTGIRSLKIGYNKVFGYFIEVSKSNTHLVPEHYERRQTLANAERYTLAELKNQEARILNAEEKSVEREYDLFCQLREFVLQHLGDIQRAAETIAQADVLCALGAISAERQYVRPVVVAKRGIHIVQGRHPVVEAAHPGKFVPNDVVLDEAQNLILITGPNMAGKSTYMRQTALIVVLAHIGCYVPAQSATIGVVDRIFTRIGASDDLGAGQSTFMVEMVELAQILRQATDRSLVLLDEIGRGTSTYDGMSIAEAVMESLQQTSRRPLTLFATHYHELTEKAVELPSAANYSVLVKESLDGIVFLHAVVNRPADKSYGIQVAKLAGIPQEVIRRAEEILLQRESGVAAARESGSPQVSSVQETVAVAAETTAKTLHLQPLPLFDDKFEDVVRRLADLNVVELTPMEAMNVLYGLTKEAQEAVKWDKSR